MAKKLSVNSLSSLSKCALRAPLPGLVKNAYLLKNISTAAVLDGGYPSEYGLNPSELLTESKNDHGFQHDFRSDSDGTPRENHGIAHGRNLSSNNWVDGGDRLSTSAPYGQNVKGVYQNDTVWESANYNGFNAGNVNGDFGDGSLNFGRNSGGFRQIQGRIGEFQRNADGPNSNYWYQYEGWSSQSMNASGNVSCTQAANQSASLHYGQPGNACSPSGHYGDVYRNERPNPNGFCTQGPSSSMGSPTVAHMQNGALQNFQSMSQHVPGVGHYSPNYSAGQYQMNTNGNQDPVVTSHLMSGVSPREEPNEASDGISPIGSIEEFDAYCKEGKVKEATEVLTLLGNKLVPVDLPRYVHLMKLCGDYKALEEAKSVHEHVTRAMSPVNVYTYNRILEMYASCGSMDNASAVFESMTERNLTTWDIMITSLAESGLGEEAIDLFTRFKEAGMKPDGQLFISVFSACTAVGDVFEGMLHFESMRKDFGIVPTMEHYVSVVEMLGKVGHLDEALEFVDNMPFEPSVDVWEALMNLCRIHGHTDMGNRCAAIIEQLDSSRLNEQSRSGLVPVKPSDIAKEEERKKLAKKNLLEARSTVHEYRAGDTSHPETERIYAQLRGLRGLMKEAGYVPETRFVLHDVDQESKEDALLAHSERLAVSYGLLSSAARSPIRVIKNLRVCGDCHNALKIMSKLVGREFIMRDAKRFHHIKDGVCSCRDYW